MHIHQPGFAHIKLPSEQQNQMHLQEMHVKCTDLCLALL